MDDKTTRQLIAALKANTEVIEQQNKLTSAVLKASGSQMPKQQPPQKSPFTNMYGS